MGTYGPTKIAEAADNGYESTQWSSWATTDLYSGGGSDPNTYNMGLRWVGLTIPAGATITNAVIKAYGIEGVGGTISTKVWGRQVQNPSAYNATDIPSAVAKTTASVDWDWTKVDATLVTSPDLSAIVQELVDDYGGFANEAIAFAILNDASGINVYQLFEDFDDAGTNEPTLEITWTEGEAESSVVPRIMSYYYQQ